MFGMEEVISPRKRGQTRGVNIRHELAGFTTVGVWHGGAPDGGHADAQRIGAEIIDQPLLARKAGKARRGRQGLDDIGTSSNDSTMNAKASRYSGRIERKSGHSGIARLEAG
jgi:hypothetical protein